MIGKLWAHLSKQNKNIRFDRISVDRLSGEKPVFRFMCKGAQGWKQVGSATADDKGAMAAFRFAKANRLVQDDLEEATRFWERSHRP